ncbi:MAG: zinc-dependent alcohol dehydrogenase family protein [Candidatus Krumholzibacteria bacterium]|nr:zinc-dependent alcohol dehydrogenase family protein [Candidatus Krumholzibacteria bacterium]
MRAMILRRLCDLDRCEEPLEPVELPDPEPGPGEVLVRVAACGVCHTELDEIEGRAPPPRLPVVPGHQAVGRIERLGPGARRHASGDRVGVGWIYSACGECRFCRAGDDNLCSAFRATGRDADGGYAELLRVPERYAFPIPERFGDAEAAPLLCAGAVGYRSLRLAGIRDGMRLGLTGFGASGHLVLKMARSRYPRSPVFVFARTAEERAFALEIGAAWSGDIGDEPPGECDAIIDTTPVWRPAVEALERLAPGGRLVINAIRKEDADKGSLLDIEYERHLWMEKEIKSVANVAGRDIEEFLRLAAAIPIIPEIEIFPLEEANRALLEIRKRRIRGAKVLVTGK